MKPLLILGLALVAGPLQAASKSCDELKREIADKLEARGVHEYQLEITRPGGAAGWTVVGSCEGGSREVLYRRGAAGASGSPDAAPAADDAPRQPPGEPIRPLP